MPILWVLLSGNEHLWQVTFQIIATGELDFEKSDVVFVLWENPRQWIYLKSHFEGKYLYIGFWYQRSILRHVREIGSVLVCNQESTPSNIHKLLHVPSHYQYPSLKAGQVNRTCQSKTWIVATNKNNVLKISHWNLVEYSSSISGLS